MNKTVIAAWLCVLFGVPFSTYAEVVQSHDAGFDFLGPTQDGFNLTIDKDNGIEWLDFTLTAGRSLADVSGDDALSEWRLATADDFTKLAESAEVPIGFIDRFGALPAPEGLTFLADALGLTRLSNGSSVAVFNEEGPNPGEVRLGGITTSGFNGSGTFAILDIPNDPEIFLNQNWLPTSYNPDVGVALVRDTLQYVSVDVKPGSDAECRGTIPIAILGSATLDVTQIDQGSLSFEGLHVRTRGNGDLACNTSDVNMDGYSDLVCQFQDDATEGSLKGQLLNGAPIKGSDTFCVAH